MSDAPTVRSENGVSIYRASSAGKCVRALSALRQGYQPVGVSEKLETIFKEGHRHESHIVEDLRAQGYDIADTTPAGAQHEVQVPVSDTVALEGHLDGTVENMGGIPLECKAVSHDRFKEYQSKGLAKFSQTYADQITIYMYALGKTKALYVVKNRNTGELDIRVLEEPPSDINQIKAKVLLAEAYAEQGRLPDCDMKDWFCPTKYLCERPEEEVEIDEAIEALAKTYDEARAKEREAAGTKAEARKRLAEALGDRDKVESSGYRVSKNATSRSRIDTDKMAAELGDTVIERYTVTTMHEQLRVTKKKTKEGTDGGPVEGADPASDDPDRADAGGVRTG